MRKRRLVVLVAALLAAVVVALLWGPIRDEVRIERLRLLALADRDKLDPVRPWEIPESWRSVAGEGDVGFHAMARLLEHEDALVWAQALTAIDDWGDLVPARKARSMTIRDTASVLATLRERYPFAYLRYLMLPAYRHGTD